MMLFWLSGDFKLEGLYLMFVLAGSTFSLFVILQVSLVELCVMLVGVSVVVGVLVAPVI